MSQSAAEIDLPDPQEKPSGASAADASSDDLLAQLAGQEIDRLLAQSQTETAPPAEESAPTGTPIVEHVEQLVQSETAAPVAATEVVPQAVVAAPPSPTPAPEAKDQPKPGLLDNFEKAHAARDEATGAAERDALSTESTIDPLKALDEIDGGETDDDDSEESTAHASHDDEEDSDKMPIYLMPLALLNAPFASLESETRELFGKVALITFVNAIAVLIYIVLFRR